MTITLPETQSKFARILIAANALPLDKFIKFQSHECKDIGYTTEVRIMMQIGRELGLNVSTIDFSKYRDFLTSIWVKSKAINLIKEEECKTA